MSDDKNKQQAEQDYTVEISRDDLDRLRALAPKKQAPKKQAPQAQPSNQKPQNQASDAASELLQRRLEALQKNASIEENSDATVALTMEGVHAHTSQLEEETAPSMAVRTTMDESMGLEENTSPTGDSPHQALLKQIEHDISGGADADSDATIAVQVPKVPAMPAAFTDDNPDITAEGDFTAAMSSDEIRAMRDSMSGLQSLAAHGAAGEAVKQALGVSNVSADSLSSLASQASQSSQEQPHKPADSNYMLPQIVPSVQPTGVPQKALVSVVVILSVLLLVAVVGLVMILQGR